MIQEAFCVCDSPYCYHSHPITKEVLPCLHTATGKFYVLGRGEFCEECAQNYATLYGKDQVVTPKYPETVWELVNSMHLIQGTLESDYIEGLSRHEPDREDQ